MIITCESCSTQFAVPANAIPPGGRKVKCVKCAHVWHQNPLEDLVDTSKIEKAPKEVKPVPKGSSLPVVRRQLKATGGQKFAFVFFLVCALLAASIAYRDHIPQLKPLYDALGMKSTEGLVFSSFKTEREKVENKWKFIINTMITNESNETRNVPNIQVTAYSSGGNVLGQKKKIDMSGITLEPGEEYLLEREIFGISGSAHELKMDIGNSWELMFR